MLAKNGILILILSCWMAACKKATPTNERYANLDNTTIRTENWMHDLIVKYPEQTISLKSILLPGSHDAGMYQLTECSLGANACNTQTQLLNFNQQLLQGIRLFDIRPIIHQNTYYTYHATDCDGLGCVGAPLATILNDVNVFLENHAELVIFEISHFCRTSPVDTGLLNLFNRILGDKIYKETTTSSTYFVLKPLKDIIGSSEKGKIVLIMEGAAHTISNTSKGIFSPSILTKEGKWTNSHYLTDLIREQVLLYKNFTNKNNRLFQFNWQITQNTVQAVSCAFNSNSTSIHQTSDSANSKITPILDSLIYVNEIKKGRIPNIIYLLRLCGKIRYKTMY